MMMPLMGTGAEKSLQHTSTREGVVLEGSRPKISFSSDAGDEIGRGEK
jgi:hypothetical protein